MVEFRNNQIYDDNGNLIGHGQGVVYDNHINDKENSKGFIFDLVFDIIEFVIDIVDFFS